MDPLTSLGTVAASVQLVGVAARALLGTVSVVRDLRDAPAHTALLLSDVNRSTSHILSISNALLQAGARLFDAIPAAQLAHLASCTAQMRLAMEELQTLLSSLCNNSQPSTPGQLSNADRGKAAIKRAWNSVVAVHRRDDIARMLARVDRLNLEMIKLLEIAGLEMQASSNELSAALLVAERDNQATISALGTALGDNCHALSDRLDGIDQQNTDMQRLVGEACGQLSSIENIGIATQAAVQQADHRASEILDGVVNAGAGINNLATSVDSNHRRIEGHFSRFEAGMQANSQSNRNLSEEIRSLSNLLTTVLVDGASTSPGSRARLAGITAEEKAEMQVHVRQRLTRSPSALQQAHRRSQRFLQLYQTCDCQPVSSRCESKLGRLSFIHVSKSHHRPSCPLHHLSYQSWSYCLVAQLFPFLNQTVKFTLGVTTGAGQWSLAPPLRFRGTVRRLDSPLFRLFDKLPLLCATARPCRSGPIWNYGRVPVERVKLEWSFETTSEHLEWATLEMKKAIEAGNASGVDTDECGTSLLHVSTLLKANVG